MKKKLLTVVLCGAMMVSLVACGGTTTDNHDTDNEKEETVTDEAKVDDGNEDEGKGEEKDDSDSSNEENESAEDNSVVDLSDVYLNIAESGEMSEYCLEYRDLYIDFGPASDVYDNVRIDKRSGSNVVLYFNENTDLDYSVQYSSMAGKFSDESQREVIFPNGFETAVTGDGYTVLYTFEKEENGIRTIIMQELANDHYVSIRSFNDIGMSNADFVKAIVVNANYPIYTEE